MKNLGIGCLAIIGLFMLIGMLLQGDNSSGNTPSYSNSDWRMEEIHKVASNVDDYITTYEATGVIMKINKDVEQSTLNVLVNEYLWVEKTRSDNRNTIRYALQRKASESGLSKIKITGNSSGVDLT